MGDVPLDSLPLLEARVGYGELGRHGQLGYEGKRVSVGGRHFDRALSTHAPARLVFRADGRFAQLRCTVALNDDVSRTDSYANFLVTADGRQVAVEGYVQPGMPRSIQASIGGAQTVELEVRTGRWECCHAVWLDPVVSEQARAVSVRVLRDCLKRVQIAVPERLPRAERCIATIASAGFAGLLDDLLGSLDGYGNCRDVLRVVFVVDSDEACGRVARKHGATVIGCSRVAPLNATVKATLYTVPRVIDAEQFVCLDTDMLVLGDLRPLFGAIDASPDASVLACREGNSPAATTLERAIHNIYGGRASDFARLLGTVRGEPAYPLVVNDGLFAAGRTGLLALDGLIRSWERAPAWVDERRDVWWRNQFIFNLALARLECGVELDPTYNINLHCHDVEMRRTSGRVEGIWRGRPSRVLHFNGWGRNKYPDWRGIFGLEAGGASTG